MNTARFLKYVWPLYNIIHQSIKMFKKIAYQKLLDNFIRHLTIVILQANSQGPETLTDETKTSHIGNGNSDPTMISKLK